MVPNYLMKIADQIKERKDLTTFHLKCSCGCNDFLLGKSKNNINEQKNSFDSYWDSFKLPVFSLKQAIDKHNGEKYVYGTTFFGIRLGKFYEKDLPISNMRQFVKARCSKCGKEFVVFDSHHHGYDSLMENKQEIENNELTVKLVWTKKPKEIIVDIRNNLSYEEFVEEFGESIEKYSNAFESIDIYTITNDRKKRFFGEETS